MKINNIHWSIGILICIKLLLHLLAINQYGYFIDEYYYLAQSKNLALGYVDHAPLSIWILKLATLFIGDSLLSIRLISALAGMMVIYITSKTVEEMGGKSFSQFLAGLTILIAPIYLGIHKFYSMNSLEHFFWTLSILLLLRLIKY
ncbi:MAG: glycosyltransferase family 39 protein, partial [Spirochaetota bacterium]